MFSIDKIQNYKNMPELIAENLKEAILHGQFEGGTQLKQDEIAKQFDVSLIPVREALILLQSKKLVVCIRNKGTIVTKLHIEEMRELFELRKVLEIGCTLMIQFPCEEEHLSKMEYMIEKMETASDGGAFSRYNRLFHELFCELTQNSQISDTYEDLFIRLQRYLMYGYYLIPEKFMDTTYHKQVMVCLKKHKKEALIEVIRYKMNQEEKNLLDYLTKNKKQESIDFNEFLPFSSNL